MSPIEESHEGGTRRRHFRGGVSWAQQAQELREEQNRNAFKSKQPRKQGGQSQNAMLITFDLAQLYARLKAQEGKTAEEREQETKMKRKKAEKTLARHEEQGAAAGFIADWEECEGAVEDIEKEDAEVNA